MPSPLFRRVARQVFEQQWARSDQRQLAPQDVDELRQFIKAGATKPAPERSQSRSVRQRVSRRIAVVRHRAELQQLERLLVQSRSPLTEQQRTSLKRERRHRHGKHQRRKRDTEHQGYHTVEDSLSKS